MIFTYDNYSSEFVITVIDISFSNRHISNLEWQSMDLNLDIGHRRMCTDKNDFKLYYLVVVNKAPPPKLKLESVIVSWQGKLNITDEKKPI